MSDDAELLRRAAARVRQRAGDAIEGPWESLDKGGRLIAWRDGPGGFDDDFEYVNDEPMSHAGNAAWIAFLGPQVAEPLAAWLEAEADLVPAVAEVGETVPKLLDSIAEGEGVETKPWEVSVRLSTTPSAVAMARVLLGEDGSS